MDLPVWVPSVVMFLGILLISLNFCYLVYLPKTQPTPPVINKQITDEEAEEAEAEEAEAEEAEAYKNLPILSIQSNLEKGQKTILHF
jgi:hypothetical protein